MTTSGTPIKQRDICLVPIPFSDLSSSKRRPVLILSPDSYSSKYDDCLVVAITSKIHPQHPYQLLFNSNELDEGLLPKESAIRVDKIYSIHQKIIVRRFGRLNTATYNSAIQLLNQFISL